MRNVQILKCSVPGYVLEGPATPFPVIEAPSSGLLWWRIKADCVTSLPVRIPQECSREDKGFSSRRALPVFLEDETISRLAARAYGACPVAAAAAAGWHHTVVQDVATSKKHPAEFDILTRTTDRVAVGVTGSFGDYPSIQAMAEGSDDAIVVGFDTEFVEVCFEDEQRGWVGEDTHVVRKIVSYQFSALDPTDDRRLRHVVVLPKRYDGPIGPRIARLSFEKAIEIAITSLGLHEHRLARGWDKRGVPSSHGRNANDKWEPNRWYRKNGCESSALKIVLVAHFQQADLTTFVDRRKALNTWTEQYPGRQETIKVAPGYDSKRSRWLDFDTPDILRTVISASAGMVSPKPVRMILNGDNWRWRRPIELSIRDTMAQSGAKPLKDLGASVGVPKLDVPGDWISRMDEYLDQHPVDFLEYASNDAVIALEYCTLMYGKDKGFPLSLPTAGARVMRRLMTGELGGSSSRFDAMFGGLVKVDKVVDCEVSVEKQLDYYKRREQVPVDLAAADWQHACARSFRGGYNMCSEVGLFNFRTFDFDLISCYPTSASTIWDVDYLHPGGVIERTIEADDDGPVELTLDDFKDGPLTPFVGFVSFSFPDSVAYPTIPVPVDGSILYPRSSGDMRGVYCIGPEVWLALKLGAKVTCLRGFFARVLRGEGGNPSRLLRSAYKQVLDDRARAKKEYGRKSFFQEILKLIANSGYGKLSQGVRGLLGWDAWAQERDPVGGSAITSPWHASMTTGLVRAVLLATLNQLHDLGYSTPSCTTDGFITNATIDVLDSLDLFGLAEVWCDTREALTGSRQMWEAKHEQTDLLNITTRANFSRESGGVLAHGGYKLPAGIAPDSQEDRDYMYALLASRTGALPVEMKVFPSVQEMTRTDKRLDFSPKTVHKQMCIEFDRKRRPVPDGMTLDFVEIKRKRFEVAHVRTVPWNDPEEAKIGRAVDKGLKVWDEEAGNYIWQRSPVRRTGEQWFDYFVRLDHDLNAEVREEEAKRLDRIAKSIVLAHRQEVITIPWLDSRRPLSERLDAFEDFSLPRPKERFWAHARSKSERQIDIDFEGIKPYVAEMLTVDPFADELIDLTS